MSAPACLADVHPGDLFFSNIGGIVPGIFPVKAGQLMLGEHARIGRRSFDHVGIVVESEQVDPLELPRGERAMWGSDGHRYELPRAVQAMPRGAEEISLTEAKHWTDSVTFMRLPEDYPGQAADAAAIARAMIGTPYSFASYAALAAWRWGIKAKRLEKWIGRRDLPAKFVDWPSGRGPLHTTSRPSMAELALPAEAICSVLVDQAWSLAGKKILTGVPHQCVTPGALAVGLLWMPGVEKFGKGILGR